MHGHMNVKKIQKSVYLFHFYYSLLTKCDIKRKIQKTACEDLSDYLKSYKLEGGLPRNCKQELLRLLREPKTWRSDSIQFIPKHQAPKTRPKTLLLFETQTQHEGK